MKYRIRKEGWFPPPSQVQHERHWFVLTDTHGRSEQLAVLLDAKPPGGQTVAACEAGSSAHVEAGTRLWRGSSEPLRIGILRLQAEEDVNS